MQARATWKTMRGNEMEWGGVEGGYLYISASVVPVADTLVTLYQFGGSTQACMVYPNKPGLPNPTYRDVCVPGSAVRRSSPTSS